MGNVHTPKTIYKHGLVVEYYVKNKEIFYKISRWIKDGTIQASLTEGKLSEFKSPEEVMEYAWVHFSSNVKAQQKFTGVMQK